MDFYLLTGASPLALAKFIYYTDLQLVKITQTTAIAKIQSTPVIVDTLGTAVLRP